MKRTAVSLCPLVVLLVAGALSAAAAAPPPPDNDPGVLFAEANAAYEAGDFARARELYEGLVAGGQYSSDLFHNLGNASVRLDDPGSALLNYQRALTLDPRHAEAAHNAAFVRSKLPEIPAAKSAAQRFFGYFSATEYALLLTGGFWVLAAAAAIAFLTRLSPPLLAVGLLAALTAALGAAGFLVQRPLDPDASSALSIASHARAHFAPAESSPTVAPVPPGTPLRILSKNPGWVYVRLPDQRLGWMPEDAVAPLIPPGGGGA